MKGFKQTLCLLLVGCLLLLAACSSAEEKEPTFIREGRYVETDITPNVDGEFFSFQLSNETIVCFDKGFKKQYTSVDGGSNWSETPGPGANTHRFRDVRDVTLLEDNSLLLYIQNEGLMRLTTTGDVLPYPVETIDRAIKNGENVFISVLQALKGNRLLLDWNSGGLVQVEESDKDSQEQGDAQKDTKNQVVIDSGMTNKTELYDLATGSKIADLPVESAAAATSDESSLYLMDMSGSVTAYRLADGTKVDTSKINFRGEQKKDGAITMVGLPGMGSTLAINGNGELFTAYEGTILRAHGDGTIQTVLESTGYSMGTPGSSIQKTFVLQDGSILINLSNNTQTNRLYKYVWDENATVDPNKTLSVWSLNDNPVVRAAITELRKKNPDSKITYEVALSGDNALSAQDAIKTLNTQLLNGSGPDVLILDGCPEASYVEKGMLLELSSLLDTSDIYNNLLAAYRTDEKIYCLPTQFTIPVLMGSAEGLAKVKTLGDLVALVVNGKDVPAGGGKAAPETDPFAGIPEGDRAELNFSNLRELWDVLWPACAPTIVADNQLNIQTLRQYLEVLKAMSDKCALVQEQDGDRVELHVAVSGGGGAPTQVPGSLVNYAAQQTNYGAILANNLQLMQLMMERSGSELTLFPGLASGAWLPGTVAGIYADTEAKDFAVQFMQTMISLEVQQLGSGTGLPVTHSGLSAQMGRINEKLKENDRGRFNFNADALIGALQVPYKGDTVQNDMMWAFVEKYCKGEIDLEGAVKAIEQSIKNYLAERI